MGLFSNSKLQKQEILKSTSALDQDLFQLGEVLRNLTTDNTNEVSVLHNTETMMQTLTQSLVGVTSTADELKR